MVNFIVNTMINSNIIAKEDAEIYTFCLNYILEYTTFFIISLTLGIICGIPISMLIYLTVFLLLRAFGGGYHASSHLTCIIMSYGIISLVCIAIRVVSTNPIFFYFVLLSIIVFISFLIYILLSPIYTSNKQFSYVESKKMKKKSTLLAILFYIIYVILILNNQIELSAAIAFSYSTAAISLIAGRVINES